MLDLQKMRRGYYTLGSVGFFLMICQYLHLR